MGFMIATRTDRGNKDRADFFEFLRTSVLVDNGRKMTPKEFSTATREVNDFMRVKKNEVLKAFRKVVTDYVGRKNSEGYVCEGFDDMSHYFTPIGNSDRAVDDPETLFLLHIRSLPVQVQIWGPLLRFFDKKHWNEWTHPIFKGLEDTIAFAAPSMLKHISFQNKIGGDIKGSFSNFVTDTLSSVDCSYFTRQHPGWMLDGLENDYNAQAGTHAPLVLDSEHQARTAMLGLAPRGARSEFDCVLIPTIPGL